MVVDASQGVEAQTLANVYQAIDNNHEIIPILNKIDLPSAEPERVKKQIEDERADKKAKEGEYAQLEDLAYKSSNAFHKLTKQTKELKRDKEDVDRKEEAEYE